MLSYQAAYLLITMDIARSVRIGDDSPVLILPYKSSYAVKSEIMQIARNIACRVTFRDYPCVILSGEAAGILDSGNRTGSKAPAAFQ